MVLEVYLLVTIACLVVFGWFLLRVLAVFFVHNSSVDWPDGVPSMWSVKSVVGAALIVGLPVVQILFALFMIVGGKRLANKMAEDISDDLIKEGVLTPQTREAYEGKRLLSDETAI